MGTGETLMSDMQHIVIMPVVALNMMVLLFLINNASESYLNSMRQQNNIEDQATDEIEEQISDQLKVDIEFERARLRLEIFWTFVLIAATAAALKLTLPATLADNIIAAWFVGQGFALQPYVQSFISGVTVRNNHDVWTAIMDKATLLIDGDAYKCHAHNVFSLTVVSLAGASGSASSGKSYRVLQWQNVAQYTISSKQQSSTLTNISDNNTQEKVDGISRGPHHNPYLRFRRGEH